MSENLKKFLEYVSQNEQLKQEIESLGEEGSKEKLILKAVEAAKAAGLELSAADFDTLSSDDTLSEEELAGVAGGDRCFCALAGVGDSSDYRNPCLCSLGGGGTGTKKEHTCGCVMAGVGK